MKSNPLFGTIEWECLILGELDLASTFIVSPRHVDLPRDEALAEKSALLRCRDSVEIGNCFDCDSEYVHTCSKAISFYQWLIMVRVLRSLTRSNNRFV